jgi:glycosyltransferase involved in cell wall biosynthesis
VRQLVDGLAQAGWQQRVLNPFASRSHRTALIPDGVDADYAFYPADSLRDLPGLRRWLRGEIGHFRPAIVHGHLFHASVVLATISRSKGESRILTHHHGNLFALQGRRLHATLDRWATSRFDHVVAVSKAVSTFLGSTYRYPSSRTSVIPNAWDQRFARISSASGAGHILCVANLRREKSLDVLLRAFEVVVIAGIPARLTIVGEGPMRAELEELATRLGIDDKVTFAGFQPDIGPFLAKATVYCLPSSYETLGISILEAMAAGVPVVATRVGGLPELVQDGTTGYLVEAGDHRHLAERIMEIVNSTEMRDRMGAAAETAAAPYSIQAMVDKYLELYASMQKRVS